VFSTVWALGGLPVRQVRTVLLQMKVLLHIISFQPRV